MTPPQFIIREHKHVKTWNPKQPEGNTAAFMAAVGTSRRPAAMGYSPWAASEPDKAARSAADPVRRSAAAGTLTNKINEILRGI